jgi:hypothetical protein
LIPLTLKCDHDVRFNSVVFHGHCTGALFHISANGHVIITVNHVVRSESDGDGVGRSIVVLFAGHGLALEHVPVASHAFARLLSRRRELEIVG